MKSRRRTRIAAVTLGLLMLVLALFAAASVTAEVSDVARTSTDTDAADAAGV